MVFSFLIAAQIQRRKGTITLAEWNLLLRGAGTGVATGDTRVHGAEWVLPAQWRMCAMLEESVPAFSGLAHDLADHALEWREYVNCPEPRICPKLKLV